MVVLCESQINALYLSFHNSIITIYYNNPDNLIPYFDMTKRLWPKKKFMIYMIS